MLSGFRLTGQDVGGSIGAGLLAIAILLVLIYENLSKKNNTLRVKVSHPVLVDSGKAENPSSTPRLRWCRD
jgi:hypothetical protein